MTGLAESTVEQAALAWLQGVGWSVRQGPEIAPDEAAAERNGYDEVVLPGASIRTFRQTLWTMPSES